MTGLTKGLLLATGIASFGHISGVHYQNLPEWNQYIGAIGEGRLPLGRAFTPTAKQALIREMILLLKRGYLEIDYFQDKFGVDIWSDFQDVWDQHVSDGFVERDGNRIILTMEGLLRADGLLTPFFEPEFRGVRYT